MRLIATCMASNEGDVIEAFVRHNSAYVDSVVVLDHGSLDRTPAILAALAKEGLALHHLHDARRGFHQGERQTYLARRYLLEHDADHCFALDADELIKAGSRAELEAALARVPPGHAAVVPVQNYVGRGNAPSDDNPARRLTRRLTCERAQPHKVVLPRRFATEADLHVSVGNHAVVRVADGRAEPIPHVVLPGVFLAHFPVRSADQVARKVLLGWLGHRLAMPATGGEGLASHWRGLFDDLAAGSLVDEALTRRAVAACLGGPIQADGKPREVSDDELMPDPMPTPYELRYSDGATLAPMAMLAAWANRLVSDIKSEAREPIG